MLVALESKFEKYLYQEDLSMESVESLSTKESQLKEKRFYNEVKIGCLIIFSLGCIFAVAVYKEDASKNQRLFQIILSAAGGLGTSGILTSQIKLYFDGREAQLRRATIRERRELEREIPSEYRYSAEMDFLSVYYLKTKDIPDTSYEDFCQQIRGFCDSRGGIRDKVKKYMEQHCRETTDEVLKGLNEGFSKNEGDDIDFYILVKQACNHALKLEDDAEVVDWALPFYKDIVLYLDAWLRSSVRYGFAIPIHPLALSLEALDEEEKKLDKETIGNYCPRSSFCRKNYREEESYINAIEYIRENVSSKEMLKFFPTPASQQMVKDYLGKLVHFLEDEKLVRSFQDDLDDSSINLS